MFWPGRHIRTSKPCSELTNGTIFPSFRASYYLGITQDQSVQLSSRERGLTRKPPKKRRLRLVRERIGTRKQRGFNISPSATCDVRKVQNCPQRITTTEVDERGTRRVDSSGVPFASLWELTCTQSNSRTTAVQTPFYLRSPTPIFLPGTFHPSVSPGNVSISRLPSQSVLLPLRNVDGEDSRDCGPNFGEFSSGARRCHRVSG